MRESGDRIDWRPQDPRWRRFLQAWLIVVLLFFLATFLFGDMSGMTRVSAVLNVLVALLLLTGGRTGTAADAHGIEISGGFKTRRVPWTAVEELRPLQSQWTDPSVEVHLTDGSTRTLPGVPPDDLPRLEELRTARPTPSTE